MIERGGKIAARGLPELKRAELRDAVFDVVERDLKDVKLPVPDVGAGLLESAPILAAAEAVHEREPEFFPRVAGVAGMGIDPVLERIDGGHPREKLDDAFEMIALGALRVLLGIERAQMGRG